VVPTSRQTVVQEIVAGVDDLPERFVALEAWRLLTVDRSAAKLADQHDAPDGSAATAHRP
jgi:hypothetical protein